MPKAIKFFSIRLLILTIAMSAIPTTKPPKLSKKLILYCLADRFPQCFRLNTSKRAYR